MTRLEELLNMYFEKFGENYPLQITGEEDDETIIADIKDCIADNEPAPRPDYKNNDVDY